MFLWGTSSMVTDKLVTGSSQRYSRNSVKRRCDDVGSPCRSSAAADNMMLELATPSQEAEIIRLRAREVRLMGRIEELEEELDDVKACIRAPGSEQAMLRTTISNLQRMLQVHNRSIDDFKALETDSLAFQRTPIKAQFNCLYLGVYDTAGGICDLSSSDDLPEKLSDISELSDIWARRAGGAGFSDLVVSAEKVKVPKMQLLASIQTAGIFHLVFESAFPDILAIESPMLDQYRKIIAGAGQNILPFVKTWTLTKSTIRWERAITED
ncbi:hypothetical protein FBULB1_1430 [Fusarium bulbicola]|nr:hypothetical protein FBULB1_1430 [Fusarium bulbicola]